eukprot:PLAT11626.4.p1 GENE.PLAT11626.4~~PLAT11626.4.p1  ORF type:complete len:121 (-),score=27.05 PLAT11626.4:164-526(-)
MRVVAICLPNRKALVYHVTEEERVRVLKEAEERREREKREWERKRVLSNPDTPIEEWLEAVADGLGGEYGQKLKDAGATTAVHLIRAQPKASVLKEVGVDKRLAQELIVAAVKEVNELGE